MCQITGWLQEKEVGLANNSAGLGLHVIFMYMQTMWCQWCIAWWVRTCYENDWNFMGKLENLNSFTLNYYTTLKPISLFNDHYKLAWKMMFTL